MVYLAGSKLSVADLGNLAFAVSLSWYKLITWVSLAPCTCGAHSSTRSPPRAGGPGRAAALQVARVGHPRP